MLISTVAAFVLKRMKPHIHLLVCFTISFVIVFMGFIAIAVAIVKITGF